MSHSKKRFIAGAVCPACSDQDSLVLYSDDQRIECVSCDYSQTSQQRDAESNDGIAKSKTALNPKQKSNNKQLKFKDASIISITNLDG